MILANLFPWSGEYEQAARQFNAQMQRRYEHVIDFIKLHYCLSQRDDTAFWRDNRDDRSISETLKEKLRIWRHRPPSFLDVDLNHDIFVEQNWQYILYGMGFATDLSGRAPALRFSADAREEFASIAEQARFALTVMPDHRALIDQVRRSGFQRPAPARRASR